MPPFFRQLAFFGLLIANFAYGLRAIIRDWSKGQLRMASVGAVCLLGMNFLLVWLIYEGIENSGDL